MKDTITYADLEKMLENTEKLSHNIPAEIRCGVLALELFAAACEKTASISIYSYSALIGIPVLRDFTLPPYVIEIRNRSGKVIDRFLLDTSNKK